MVGQAPPETFQELPDSEAFHRALVAILSEERPGLSTYHRAYLLQFATEDEMKLKAKDSFHASGLGMVHARQEFEAHDALGRELADKGLAEILEASTDTAAGAKETEPAVPKEGKADLPPLNKADFAHADKADRPSGARSEAKAAKARQPKPTEE